MSDETKEAVRLLFECADEIRLHENSHHHVTRPELKKRLRDYLVKIGLDNPEKAVEELVLPQ